MHRTMLVFCFMVTVAKLSESVTIVEEVKHGEMAELHCPSNDDKHRFQFWQLQRENTVIGPTNLFNRDKYKYEVLTGTLYIRGVSSHENGLYTCVSRHIQDDSFYSETVELIVMRGNWEEPVQQANTFSTMFYIMLVLAVLMVTAAVVVFFWNFGMDRAPSMTGLVADEESPDEAGPSYRPSTGGRALSPLDSHGLDTDLPRPQPPFTDIRLNK